MVGDMMAWRPAQTDLTRADEGTDAVFTRTVDAYHAATDVLLAYRPPAAEEVST